MIRRSSKEELFHVAGRITSDIPCDHPFCLVHWYVRSPSDFVDELDVDVKSIGIFALQIAALGVELLWSDER